MNRFASELETKKIILRQEGAVIGRVLEPVISPDDGAFLGFLILKKGRERKALAEKDILGINNEFVLVENAEAIAKIDDIVRIKKVYDQKINIIGNRVYTVSECYLGRVSDFTIDFVSAQLSRLYVEPKNLARLSSQYLIDAARIVSIEKHRITVEDATVKDAKKVRAGVIPVKPECN